MASGTGLMGSPGSGHLVHMPPRSVSRRGGGGGGVGLHLLPVPLLNPPLLYHFFPSPLHWPGCPPGYLSLSRSFSLSLSLFLLLSLFFVPPSVTGVFN